MYSIRSTTTNSGSTATQVVRYVRHKTIVYKHIVSVRDDAELDALKQGAMQ